jgi:sporulation protein YlmC with PRC-barrel domain
MQHQSSSYDAWIGRDAVDSTGDKIGSIKDIYYDDETGRPEWVAVKPGMFKGLAFVPIHNATTDEDGNLRLAFTKAFIEGAPDLDPSDDHLTPADEQNLWSYFGYDYAQRGESSYGKNYGKLRPDVDYQYARYDRQRGKWAAPGETVTTEDRGEVVSEATAVSEQVQKTQTPETVRLRKYQHTEMVPVTKEEIRVEKDVDPTDTTTTTRSTRSTR